MHQEIAGVRAARRVYHARMGTAWQGVRGQRPPSAPAVSVVEAGFVPRFACCACGAHRVGPSVTRCRNCGAPALRFLGDEPVAAQPGPRLRARRAPGDRQGRFTRAPRGVARTG